MTEVEELCAALTIIHRGRVVFSGTADELRSLAPHAVHALRTSDDRSALDLALHMHGLRVTSGVDGGGFELLADSEALDAYVIALGRAGVAVRALEHRARSLESLFLQLTGQAAATQELAPESPDALTGPRTSSTSSTSQGAP
jgi:ABC-2 type transport system ATP-binding protein